jgi:hypothetical protein
MANRQNYLKRKESQQKQRLETGLVSECFPKVASIVIKMKNSHGRINPINIQRTLNFWPHSNAYFHIGCLRKGCVDGGFDLNQIIANMVKKHETSSKGMLFCKGSNLPSKHAQVFYTINIKYHK